MKKYMYLLLLLTLCQFAVFAQNPLSILNNKYCYSGLIECPNTFFSDTLILETEIVDPAYGTHWLKINSVTNLPPGVSAQITDSVIDITSPFLDPNWPVTVNQCAFYPQGVGRYTTIILSGVISQAGYFTMKINCTDSCTGYLTGFAGTSPTGSPYLTGFWNYSYSTDLGTISTQYKPNFTFTQASPTCGLSNGGLQAVPPQFPYGFFPQPYVYSWSNGATTATANNLTSGIHSLYLTDEMGCDQIYNVPLGSTGGPIVTVDTIFPSCSNNGVMNLIATGNAPFTYSWLNGATSSSLPIQRNQTYEGLVIDANNCASAFQVNIPNKQLFKVNDVITLIRCHGEQNGKITLNPLFGTPPYVYSWSTGVTGTNAISNLGAGTYLWSVTDANGCTVSDTTILIDPSPLHFSPITSPATCVGACDAKIQMGATGGNGGYLYKKNNQTYISPPYPYFSCEGAWLFTVIDAGGCRDSAVVNVNAPYNKVESITPECAGLNNGAFCVNPNGGTYAVTGLTYYNPTTGSQTSIPFTLNCVNNLSAGEYEIFYFGGNVTIGCIDQFSELFIIDSITVNTATAFTYTQNGNIVNLTSQGGSAASYDWSAISLGGGTTPTFNNDTIANPVCTLPSSGAYVITLTVNAGTACVSTFSDTIAYGVTCDIGGVVSIGGTPADDYKVYLINYDANTQLLTAIDSLTGTAANAGAYVFANLPIGDYRVKASLLPSSAHFVDYLPTYYQNALLWNQADVITLSNPCLGSAVTYDIALTSGVNTSGVGFIGGYVFNGANRLLQDTVLKSAIEVILFDNAMQPIAYDYSDANGYVSFGGLPMGTYHLMADALNQPSDTLLITLTTASPTGDFLFFMLGDGVSGSNVTSIDAEDFAQNIQILPNPHSASFTIQTQMKQSAEAQYQLFNTLGQKVLEANQKVMEGYNEFQVISADLPSGVYFLHLTFNSQSHVVRKVIKE